MLALAALACEPVLTIGWNELAIVIILLLVLLGPPLFRLWAKWEAFKRDQEQRRKK
jgi:hypothetical protein